MIQGTREFYPIEIQILKIITQHCEEQSKRNEGAKEPAVLGLDCATLQQLVEPEEIDGVEGRRPVHDSCDALYKLGALDLARNPSTGAVVPAKYVVSDAGAKRLEEYQKGKRKPLPYPKRTAEPKGEKAVQFAAESKDAIAAVASQPLQTTANTGERARGGARRN